MSPAGVTRLHVSPLTVELLPTILGSHVQVAHNISYHHLQTFPEKSYGYLDLPEMDAEKVKKKLNGAILKGKKMKIEDARPKKRKHADADESAGDELSPTKPVDKSTTKRAKKDRNVVQGRELSPDRKVKRGWTEQKPAGKKSKADRTNSDRPASKYTNKEELLFRTKLPEIKADLAPTKKKGSKKSKGSHTVHEFEKSVAQPSFLKESAKEISSANLEYVDGQGWVDPSGKVVEKEPGNLRERRKARKRQKKDAEVMERREPSEEPSATSSSASDTSDADETTNASTEKSQSVEPHPLVSLFKKPQKPASLQDVAKPSLEVATSFSFFGSAARNDIEEEPNVPGTPFSSQDVRSRGLRSAAPTPDTAHPSRFNSYGSTGLPGDEERAEEIDSDAAGKTPTRRGIAPGQAQSDFAKMFWEKRGDNNRSWKARRRTVLKEKRQRENRARRPKNW